MGIKQAMPFRLFIDLFVIVLGLISSIITAIIAAIILVSVLSVLQLEQKTERSIVIIACYAIGMGAALTPIGEPLSTIVTGNLKDRKSTRLNSSHVAISYAVFCLKH